MSKPVLRISLRSTTLLSDLRDDLVEELDEENLAHFLALVATTGGSSVPRKAAKLLVEYLKKSSPKERPFDVTSLLVPEPVELPPLKTWPFPKSTPARPTFSSNFDVDEAPF